ncbi:hypothetical protein CfE428DRAFT_4012 [Chthoniobacter flavus Ellin428]|uniref:Peptidase S1 and S6 chymotrypsin/Hap n=1 Tax=Chthoniobacter flavus Ellin428 TaxID=497964 RepID=B4D523_9BACT|nr:serine protease [Chthoniobacter flavus]EDY18626.1 hypothetical protein CfE428DRAFT_4012 [Chthoniobacter flavus Ellin428]TCO90918.1 trypsin-like peptidase [Chthoniobacter flavus]
MKANPPPTEQNPLPLPNAIREDSRPRPVRRGSFLDSLSALAGKAQRWSWTLCAITCVAITGSAGADKPAETKSGPAFANTQIPGIVWKDRIAEENLWGGGWHRDGTTISAVRNQAFVAFPEVLKDGAIRVRFRYDGPEGSFIDLQTRTDGKAVGHRYVVTLFIGKEADHKVTSLMRVKTEDIGKDTQLGGTGSLAQLQPGDEHTLELYSQGDHQLYYFDGKLAISAQDAHRQEGKLGLFTGGQLHYLSVETADLSHAPPLGPSSLSTAKPSSPSSPPTSSSQNLTTAEMVKTYHNSLVFITGTNGSGSGFVAKYSNGTFLFTNAHVAAGVRGAAFKTLEGTEVKTGAASCAVGHDVFLFQPTTAVGQPLEIMTAVDENAAIGDEVVVLGNAEGAGVINTITGRIVGLGPQLVEVDAPFQPGNSGSPIIHLKSGKVIGVATYSLIRKYDPTTREPVKNPIVRRFGYRLDSIKSWQPVNWNAFFAQATEMEAIEKLTNDLAAFLRDLAKNKHVTPGAHNNPAIKSRIDAWAEARSRHLSPHDASLADESFISFLKATSEADVTAARQHITYDYFQRALADQQRERDAIANVFKQIVQELRR